MSKKSSKVLVVEDSRAINDMLTSYIDSVLNIDVDSASAKVVYFGAVE